MYEIEGSYFIASSFGEIQTWSLEMSLLVLGEAYLNHALTQSLEDAQK